MSGSSDLPEARAIASEWALPQNWYWYKDPYGWHVDHLEGEGYALWDPSTRAATGTAPPEIKAIVERRNTDG